MAFALKHYKKAIMLNCDNIDAYLGVASIYE